MQSWTRTRAAERSHCNAPSRDLPGYHVELLAMIRDARVDAEQLRAILGLSAEARTGNH